MVNFHDYSQSINPVEYFWIVDPVERKTKDPAFFVYEKPERWDVEVHCRNLIDLKFTAVDNNIPIYKGVSKDLASRCDVIINSSKTICIIEIKTCRYGAVPDALKQIEATINHIINDFLSYRFKRAFVCNTRNSRFAISYIGLQNSFYKKYKAKLTIHCNVIDNIK